MNGDAHRYGLAIDYGTDRIRIELVDRENGRPVTRVDCANRLAAFGPDILTRITACEEGEETRQAIFDAATAALAEALDRLPEVGGFDVRGLPAVIAANATHMYLLLRRDPGCIARPPYEIPLHAPESEDVAAAGLPLTGHVYFAPCLANYLGGDTVCAVLAARLHRMPDGSALLDLGANAELVIAKGDTLWAGSCAAGCALGSGGFTGSELAGIVAGFHRERLLNRRGRLQKGADRRITEVLLEGSSRPMAAVAFGGKTLFQSDIASFMQAKASVATMIDYMLEKAELTADELKSFTLTGALGCALDIDAAITTGLLPNMTGGTYSTMTDTVLTGARMLLLDPDKRAEVVEICRRLRYVQLREVEDYLELMLPHLALP